MIEPTDEDIREAKRLTRPDWVVYKDSYSGLTYRELAQLCGLHARTLAKLRLAVKALEAVNNTDGHQSYATQLSEACDIASAARSTKSRTKNYE